MSPLNSLNNCSNLTRTFKFRYIYNVKHFRCFEMLETRKLLLTATSTLVQVAIYVLLSSGVLNTRFFKLMNFIFPLSLLQI